MHIYRLTYIVLVLVIIAGTTTITTLRGKVQGPSAKQKESQDKVSQREEEARKHFPTAEFDEQEPTDPQKLAALRKKKVRHNKLGLVYRNPGHNTGGGAILPEHQFDFPALPTALSDAVVLGEVIDAQAHLSDDKTNVYSEFTIRIDKTFKSGGSLQSEITVERIGGWVRYPDGRKLFYQFGSAGMPRVSGKYLLFLKCIPKTDDLTILTGYELGPTGVAPLDFSGQFENYRGSSHDSLLIDLNNALGKE